MVSEAILSTWLAQRCVIVEAVNGAHTHIAWNRTTPLEPRAQSLCYYSGQAEAQTRDHTVKVSYGPKGNLSPKPCCTRSTGLIVTCTFQDLMSRHVLISLDAIHGMPCSICQVQWDNLCRGNDAPSMPMALKMS